MIAHALVDPLVAAAEQRETGARGELAGQRLVEPAPTGTEQEEGTRRRHCLHGPEDRLRAEHHSRAAAERWVVDRSVAVGGVVAQVMETEIDQAVLTRPTEQAPGKRGLQQLR